MKRLFIAVEGIDGSGKSSLVKFLESKIKSLGMKVARVATREENVEHTFSSVCKDYDLDPNSSAYMFFFQMLHALKYDRIKKILDDGLVAIADRWDFSFLVYHQNFGFFSRETENLRFEVNRLAFNNLCPDVGIYMDVSVSNAIDRRMYMRGEVIDCLEKEKEFYEVITGAYRKLAAEKQWHVLDANKGFDEIKMDAWEIVHKALSTKP
ncbi:MAG: deoxynucleoside kinase [Smithella sp.]|nr:deoxynucleoside kinase [Smithella sp.]MDD5527624.1 deoxynucleoside kinase [Patescibacteria group bacterium]